MFLLKNDASLITTSDFDLRFNPFDDNKNQTLAIVPRIHFEIKSDSRQKKIDDWNLQMLYPRRPHLKNDSAPKSMQKISPKIREMVNDNRHFNKILQTAFSEISFLLDKDEIGYQINVDVEEDKEFSEWKETVVSIKISNMSQEDVFQMWETIENQIQSKINQIDDETVKEQYKSLVIVVTNFDDQ